MLNLTGKNIKGYQFAEWLGGGSFGEVWRAERRIGRKTSQVAIKVVQPADRGTEETDGMKSLDNIALEAQKLASIQHPRVVPLFDYQYDSRENLVLMVMPVLSGPLDERIEQLQLSNRDRFPIETALRWIEQLIEGLAYVHGKKNFVHRDLKPENILLDAEDNVYLSDFGMSQDLVGSKMSDEMRGGNIKYAAPEQWGNPYADYRADIYALSLISYELLAGYPFDSPTMHLNVDEMPSIHERFPDIPVEVDRVLAKAKALKASERYTSVGDFGRALREALFGIPDDSPLDVSNPYQGLWAFSEDSSNRFFGREALVKRLIERLSQAGEAGRFCALVGASGSGKSSVVRAGLIPGLSKGDLSGSQHWHIAHMVPEDRPLIKLEAALKRSSGVSGSLLEQLQGKDGLLRVLEWILPEDDAVEQVLICDQFEELFTQTTDEQERTHFLDILASAVTAPHSRFRLIIALRADFYDRPLQHAGMGELIRKHTEVVLPMSQAELREAITKPAEAVGARWEPGLVETIIAHVENQPGALPLLQHTLSQIFDRDSTRGRRLTRSTYEALGGVAGALSQTSDDLYKYLDEEGDAGKQAAKQVFLRLVTLGEGAEDTRRRANLLEVVSVSTDAQRVIDVYTMNRLLITDRNSTTGMTTVEIAHEALIRNWGRLREWLDYSRSEIPTQRLLSRLAQEWEVNRDPDLLARGQRLDDLIGFVKQTELVLTDTERSYVKESQKQRDDEIEAETERIKREQALIEERKQTTLRAEQAALQADHRSRLLRRLIVIFSIVTALFTAVVFKQQTDAHTFALDQRYRTRLGYGGIFVDGKLSEEVIDSINRLADWQPQSQMVDGVEMVYVPSGCFYMGSLVSTDTQPIGVQCLDYSFWIDRYEVTNAQFARLSVDPIPSTAASSGENQPVNNVHWGLADEFCRSRGGRLPSEMEWEYAARGPRSLAYPWGDRLPVQDAYRAVYGGSSNPSELMTNAGLPARPDGMSWVGTYDQSGNVFEWTNSIYDQELYPYPYQAGDGREMHLNGVVYRVLRGGSYRSNSEELRTAFRFRAEDNTASAEYGFRCVRDVIDGQ